MCVKEEKRGKRGRGRKREGREEKRGRGKERRKKMRNVAQRQTNHHGTRAIII